jgi:hypothetical protein
VSKLVPLKANCQIRDTFFQQILQFNCILTVRKYFFFLSNYNPSVSDTRNDCIVLLTIIYLAKQLIIPQLLYKNSNILKNLSYHITQVRPIRSAFYPIVFLSKSKDLIENVKYVILVFYI